MNQIMNRAGRGSRAMRLVTGPLSKRQAWVRRGRQSGVGLIEILIAVLVLSIGFLGMAALQARALSNNNSAMARSMGTIASYSILDAMRIDPDGVQAGDYDDYSVTVPDTWSQPGDCDGLGSGGALAQANQNQWCDDLGSLMGPGTTGEISTDGSGGNYIITITFDDERATGGESEQTMITRAKL